jgi:hypothetical protein
MRPTCPLGLAGSAGARTTALGRAAASSVPTPLVSPPTRRAGCCRPRTAHGAGDALRRQVTAHRRVAAGSGGGGWLELAVRNGHPAAAARVAVLDMIPWCRSSAHTLFYWPNAGRILPWCQRTRPLAKLLVKYWSYTPDRVAVLDMVPWYRPVHPPFSQVLVKYWSNTGQTLVKYPASWRPAAPCSARYQDAGWRAQPIVATTGYQGYFDQYLTRGYLTSI